jgi:hypothetical protein
MAYENYTLKHVFIYDTHVKSMNISGYYSCKQTKNFHTIVNNFRQDCYWTKKKEPNQNTKD